MDQALRLSFFLAILLTMMAAEYFRPRRAQKLPRIRRWPSNLALVVLDNLLVRLILPITLIEYAALVTERGWGLLPALDLPFWPTFFLSLLALDLIIYGQHVAFHRIPFLWRLHRVHHTDTEFDVTTALRFHPFEILISLAIKFSALTLLGVPPEAALAFEIILNASAMFNHGNIALPLNIDRWLRRIIVTPDMHRVHHSVIMRETNSNYGFNIPLWDRLFGTYNAQPEKGHIDMQIGLDVFRDPAEARLDRLLVQPLK